jgi:hypothetical protein
LTKRAGHTNPNTI